MECTCVGVREQSSLSQDQVGHSLQVLERGSVSVARQPVGGDRVPELGALAERKQRFVTSG